MDFDPWIQIRTKHWGSEKLILIGCKRNLKTLGFKTSVAVPDPGSGAFLTLRSGIWNKFFPDPGSNPQLSNNT